MAAKYKNIRRTSGFIADYAEISSRLRARSPVAHRALPQAMTAILDVIERHPRGWPIRRKTLAGAEYEFHLAIAAVAYRRIHVRYYVDDSDISYLQTAWIDGQDEPNYVIDTDTH